MDEVREYAYRIWRTTHYAHREKEKMLEEISFPEKQNKNWLRIAREAQFLSSDEVAKRMQISQSAYTRLERAEAAGKLTLRNLQRAAEAIGCEVVYAIRPKNKQTFSKMVWEIIAAATQNHITLKRCRPSNVSRVWSAVARDYMQTSNERAINGWTFHKGWRRQKYYP